MNKYKVSFRGRQAGATGIFYVISDTYHAANLSELKSLVYEDYENIQGIDIAENGNKISRNDFDNSGWVKVRSNKERQRDENGSYLHTRTDSPINS